MKTTRQAFTIVELLVVISLIILLIALLLPGLGLAREQGRRLVCASNARQTATAVLEYSNDYNGRLPTAHVNNMGQRLPWLWDMPEHTVAELAERGIMREQMYCPSNTHQNDDGLWNWNWYKVLGYYWLWEMTGNQPPLTIRSANGKLRNGYIVFASTQGATELELITDANISQNGNFAQVFGGWPTPHRSPHLDPGNLPAGGNVIYLDGHGGWRQFSEMEMQSPGPQQWF